MLVVAPFFFWLKYFSLGLGRAGLVVYRVSLLFECMKHMKPLCKPNYTWRNFTRRSIYPLTYLHPACHSCSLTFKYCECFAAIEQQWTVKHDVHLFIEWICKPHHEWCSWKYFTSLQMVGFVSGPSPALAFRIISPSWTQPRLKFMTELGLFYEWWDHGFKAKS